MSLLPVVARSAALLAIVCAAACSAAPAALAEKKAKAGDPSSAGGEESPTGDGDPADPARPPRTSTGKLGVVVIDTQQVFFTTAAARNPASDIPARIERTRKVLELAAASHVPTFVTFEQSKTGDHALPAALASALPPDAQQLIKTTFAATSEPTFASAVGTSAVKRVLVLGAETDVCVLQTMLGLRRGGVEVLSLVDALVTEEVNDAPARRRLRQAGVVEVKMDEAQALITSGAPSSPPSTSAPPVIVRPLEIAVLLHDLGGLAAADPNAAAKRARLKELLLISEWFKMPVLAEDPTEALAALPADLRGLVKRPMVALATRPAQVKQVVVAGGRT
ncbi:MAG TPA: isochorismatase family protein, partial [Labilithrix sp.]|nr:isochorismatase family protein [Labilithrix sp.]